MRATTLSTFNRTSLELKLYNLQEIDTPSSPFNRTSLELKPSLIAAGVF